MVIIWGVVCWYANDWYVFKPVTVSAAEDNAGDRTNGQATITSTATDWLPAELTATGRQLPDPVRRRLVQSLADLCGDALEFEVVAVGRN